ncbi:MAG: hypothetical protein H6502_02935 [Candidatus Woesearchaeota archaeon]|nr:MAG: hypothetical protein H6502_02935 [Candidatus Woesearchaeota archaeon]
MDNEAYLRSQGWSAKEIHHYQQVISRHERRKLPHHHLLDHSNYYFSLLVSIVGNVVFTVTLLPLILFLHSSILYVLVFAIAAVAGFLFSHLLSQIAKVSKSQYLFFVVVNAIFISLCFAYLSAQAGVLGGSPDQSSLTLLYVLGYFSPFFFSARTKK